MTIESWDSASLRGSKPAWLVMRVIQYRIHWWAGTGVGFVENLAMAMVVEQQSQAFALARQLKGLTVVYT